MSIKVVKQYDCIKTVLTAMSVSPSGLVECCAASRHDSELTSDCGWCVTASVH